MFEKLKQFKDLRSQAKTVQSTLANESVTVEKNGITLVMNGNMEITRLSINSQADNNRLAEILKDVFNDGVKKTQKIMAQKMQEMGGLKGLGDLLK